MLGSQHSQAELYGKEIKPAAEKECSWGSKAQDQPAEKNGPWSILALGMLREKTEENLEETNPALLTAIHSISTASIMDNDFWFHCD